MPAGYAFSENVNGQAGVGKKRPQEIQDAEFALVQKAIRKLKCDCRAEIKDKTIVLHTANEDSLDAWLALFGAAKAKQAYADHASTWPCSVSC